MLKILYCFQYFIMHGDEIFNIKNFGKNLHLRLVEKKNRTKSLQSKLIQDIAIVCSYTSLLRLFE